MLSSCPRCRERRRTSGTWFVGQVPRSLRPLASIRSHHRPGIRPSADAAGGSAGRVQLRRIAWGLDNWLFVGSEDGDAAATFVSQIASCQQHRIEPLADLHDQRCLLPAWPASQVLSLSPAKRRSTIELEDVRDALAKNVFRHVTLGELALTSKT